MAKNKEEKKKKNTGKLPKTVQQSIPYLHIYANGVIETKPGVFTKSYEIADANFKIAPDQEQIDLYRLYQQFLDSFPNEVKFEIQIWNRATDRQTALKTVWFEPRRDGLNRFRSDFNDLMVQRLGTSKNNLTQKKVLVVSVEDRNASHAMQILESIDQEVDNSLGRITPGTTTSPMSIEERLEALFFLYHQSAGEQFGNVMRDGSLSFDLDALVKSGLTSKDIIGPDGMEFKPNYFRFGDTYGRTFFLQDVPTRLSTDFLADLTNVGCPLSVGIHYEPIDKSRAIRMVRDQLININAQVAERQKEASKNGYTLSLLPDELSRAQRQNTSLMEDLMERDQKTFFVTFVVTTFAETKEELEENTRLLTAVSSKHRAPIRKLMYQQEAGVNASLPLCVNKLDVRRFLTTESAAVFLPYTSQELFQSNGIYYGLNQVTKKMIVYSRMTGRNYNGLIFGESGSGKSFAAKCEMVSVRLKQDDSVVYIIDPEGEYKNLGEQLNGEVIELSPSSKTFLNPFDMDIDYGDEGGPLEMKSDYIISMIEMILGSSRSLNPKARSIIDRCTKNIYRGYLEHMDELQKEHPEITCDKDAMPTLNNLYQELCRQPQEEAHQIADAIEIYATGSLATFAHRSNVDSDSKLVIYDISKLGTGMKNLGLYICLNDIWNKMIANKRKNLWTWFYIDEFYLLLQSESATTFLMNIWKRARKWNGVPTGIMQNTEDLIASAAARNIINNTSFVLMLSLSKLDRVNLGELLNISDTQLEYITTSKKGHGLIYTEKTVIPFENDFPKDSSIYPLLSTSENWAN
ncbi:MAG: ATP-binding protein [Eubacteriales bacterium]|nr:ATP-binding protein [Eubacteriales bacterium]